MTKRRSRAGLLGGTLAALLALPAAATTLLQLNLEQLTDRADKIFRGTVIAIESGTVRAGGGELPIVVYRLRVEETFKGDVVAEKDGEAAVVELKVVGDVKQRPAVNGMQRLTPLADIPRLVMGEEYVLFTTRPSVVGLSVPVGLGQGAFKIVDGGKEELAVNAFANQGLNRGARRVRLSAEGPVAYRELAAAIRSALQGDVP